MDKDIEIEARWINLDENEIKRSLEKCGAQKTNDSFFKEWIIQRPEWDKATRRIRVRDDGTTTWLTYKENSSWDVDSTKEIEVTVSSTEEIIKLLSAIDITDIRYAEKKREQYKFEDIIFELDFWPKIPMVLEIEAPSKEKVMKGAELLGIKWDDAIFEDQKIVHKKYFDIDLDVLTDYKFETD